MKKLILPIIISIIFLLTTIPVFGLNFQPQAGKQDAKASLMKSATGNAAFPALYSISTSHDPLPFPQGDNPASGLKVYDFGEPARCSNTLPNSSPEVMLQNVQEELGENLRLDERQFTHAWHGKLGSLIDISEDPFAHEFEINLYQSPTSDKGDQIVSIFVQNGFAVWSRFYQGSHRLLAVPMVTGVENSIWGDYVSSYWEEEGVLNDENIRPIAKVIPCHWMIELGLVSFERVHEIFDLDWNELVDPIKTPDDLAQFMRQNLLWDWERDQSLAYDPETFLWIGKGVCRDYTLFAGSWLETQGYQPEQVAIGYWDDKLAAHVIIRYPVGSDENGTLYCYFSNNDHICGEDKIYADQIVDMEQKRLNRRVCNSYLRAWNANENVKVSC